MCEQQQVLRVRQAVLGMAWTPPGQWRFLHTQTGKRKSRKQ